MSEIGEALGTAVEGGLFSKAVSGNKGGSGTTPLERGHFAEGDCLNCGTTLVGNHCHQCGQKAHLHRTLGAFMHDLLHGALHFEGKTWKTLPMLFFKPGELTRRYVEGQRARFVSPMALFLFSIFLMFAAFQLAGISTPTDIEGATTDQLKRMAASELERLEGRRDELSKALEAEGLEEDRRKELATRLKAVESEIEGLLDAQARVPFLNGGSDGKTEPGEEVVAGVPVNTAQDGSQTIPLSVDGKRKLNLQMSGIEWIDGALDKWRTNPGLMLYKLQTNFYKFSWLLIPLSIPFVWLLFAWKRKYRAYDHAIFVTYSLSFMTLLILGITLLGLAGMSSTSIIFAILLIPPLHIYKHLRGAYGLSRFSALWRLMVLTLFILIVLVLFLQLLLVLGAF